MAKAVEFKGNVGDMPSVCDHCGGETESVGLVAPKCKDCGKFSLSHISFGPPKEIDVGITVTEHDDGSATLHFDEDEQS